MIRVKRTAVLDVAVTGICHGTAPSIPFRDGDTLWTYAKRIVDEKCPGYVIREIDVEARVINADTSDQKMGVGGSESMRIFVESQD